VRRDRRDSALSDALGAMLLISIVAMGIGIAAIALVSQPHPDKVPAVSAEITTIGRTIIISHNGGDTIQKSTMQIVMDGSDKTSVFTRLDGTPWSAWSVGDTLSYTVPDTEGMPLGVSIYYIGGKSSYMIQSMGIPSSLNGGSYYPTIVMPLPVAAGFSGSPIPVPAGGNVVFTDLSTGPVTLWSWNFGDTGTSAIQNPTHLYSTAGIYSVSLTVSNGTGSNTLTRTNYIIVNPPAPVAAFTPQSQSGTTPVSVSFNDVSTGSPTGWSWSFRNITPGNNTVVVFSTLQNPPVKTFGVGNYTIVLTASNSGGSNVSSQISFINVSKPFSQYSYYRDITPSSLIPVANYQMKVSVPYNSNMKADFGDIRFMDNDGVTPYSYWMESKTDGANAVFWVKVPAASTPKFRMYYGNSTLTTTSDGTNTFDFFSDGSSLAGWTMSSPVPTVDSTIGQPLPSFKAVGGTYAYRDIGLTSNKILEYDGYVIPGATDLCNVYFLTNAAGSGQMFRLESRAATSTGLATTTSWTSWTAPSVYGPVTAGVWHKVKIVLDSTTASGTVDGTSYGSLTFSNNGGYIAVHGDSGIVTGGNFDNIRVRKYFAPEPTTSIGSEIII
jgi:PKD repeat protein